MSPVDRKQAAHRRGAVPPHGSQAQNTGRSDNGSHDSSGIPQHQEAPWSRLTPTTFASLFPPELGTPENPPQTASSKAVAIGFRNLDPGRWGADVHTCPNPRSTMVDIRGDTTLQGRLGSRIAPAHNRDKAGSNWGSSKKETHSRMAWSNWNTRGSSTGRRARTASWDKRRIDRSLKPERTRRDFRSHPVQAPASGRTRRARKGQRTVATWLVVLFKEKREGGKGGRGDTARPFTPKTVPLRPHLVPLPDAGGM